MIRVVLALALATALVVAQPQASEKPAAGGGGGEQQQQQQQQGKAVGGEGKEIRGAGTAKGGRHFMPLWDLPRDQLQFRERPDIRGSVATATNLLMKAGLAHEPMTASVFFTPRSVIIYKNGLPNAGTYRGFSGLFDFGARSKLMFHTTAFNYTIPFVDEARGVSIVKLKYAGKFIRSGKNLESSATCYIKWRLGKVRQLTLVDDEPLAVWKAFATSAELVIGQFYEKLFSCGECAAELLANDVKVTSRMHPKRLGDMLSYQGVEEFKKRANEEIFQNALKQVRDIHILYGDENTVVVGYKFGIGTIASNVALSGIRADPRMLPGSRGTSVDSLSDLHATAVVHVKDGKIVSCTGQLSQPLTPWQVARIEAGMPKGAVAKTAGGAGVGAGGQKTEAKAGTVGGEQKPEQKQPAKGGEQKQ